MPQYEDPSEKSGSVATIEPPVVEASRPRVDTGEPESVPARPAMPASDAFTRPRSLAWALAATVIVGLLAYAVRQADADLWGHVLYGQLWLTQGIIDVDPYSYVTEGTRWIGHEIGAEIVSWWAWTLGGQAGLCVFKTVMGLLTGLVLYASLPRDGRRSWLGLLIWLAAMHTVSMFLLVRPQLFTYLFTAVTGLILYRDVQQPTRAVWLLPPVCAVWTNCHGGYVVLLGTAGLYLAGPWLQWLIGRLRGMPANDNPRPAIRLGWVLLVSGLFTLINPYGAETWVCLFKALSNPYTKDVIGEWRAIIWLEPTRQEGAFRFLAAGVIITVAIAIPWRRMFRGAPEQRIDATGLVVCGACAWMAFSSYRHIPLFAILVAPWLLRWAYRGWSEFAQARPRRARVFAPAVAFAAMLPLVPTLYRIVRDPTPRLEHLDPMPVGAVRYMQKQGLAGNIYASFNWGQYLIWHLHPQCRVGMDGRYDTTYPEHEYAANFRFVLDGDVSRAVKPPTDFILAATGSPADQSMAARSDWECIHADRVSRLYARPDALSQTPRYPLEPEHGPVHAHVFP